jgi:hypothetical protein
MAMLSEKETPLAKPFVHDKKTLPTFDLNTKRIVHSETTQQRSTPTLKTGVLITAELQ